MDQEMAKHLFEEGATLLFLDVPVGTEFGIDYNSWQVGPNFRGVKMIPPGIHFIYYSASNTEGQTAPRTGFFFNFKPQEMLVRKWDKYNEDISCEGLSEEELERYQSSKKYMDRFLGPYPYDNYRKWISMTNYISGSLLDTLLPENKKISSVTEFLSEQSTSESRKSAALQVNMETDSLSCSRDKIELNLPQMTEKPGTAIRYSEIPKVKYPPGASPTVITKCSMDSSYVLETILNKQYFSLSVGILGEVQFAFLCFLIGQNYDSFEQWKKLVHLLCSSEDALLKYCDLFMKFIGVLHFQIREIPEDFFVDIVSQNNFLTQTLQEFFSNLETNDVDPKLRKRGLKFRDHLTEKFKWDFTSEPDDYAPVVVETSDGP